MKAIELKSRIEKFLNQYRYAGKLAIAISGGADSMCLAYLSDKWAKDHKVKLIAIIIDHKLRPESSKEAINVATFLTKHGFETHILTWDEKKPKSNVQALARTARYYLLTKFCKENSIKYLLTAHNMNDQAETVLMRILRGTGIDGLCGIPKKQDFNGITILRPLLEYSREEIESLLLQIKWPWVTDPTNFDEKYDRVKIRNLITKLPKKNLAIERLSLLTKNSQRVKEVLDKKVESLYKKSCKVGSFGQITLNSDKLLAVEEEILLRLLSAILKTISGHFYPPRLESLELLYHSVIKKNPFIKTLWGCEINKKEGITTFYRELSATEPMKILIPNQENLWDKKYSITLESNNLFIGAIQNAGLKTLKSWLKKEMQLPVARILYPTPGIFNQDQELIYYPFLDLGIKKPKSFRLQTIQPTNLTEPIDFT